LTAKVTAYLGQFHKSKGTASNCTDDAHAPTNKVVPHEVSCHININSRLLCEPVIHYVSKNAPPIFIFWTTRRKINQF